MYPKLSTFQITNEKELPFDAERYSLFKYGRADIGFQYGIELCATFIAQYQSVLAGRRIVVFASPYHFIKPASAWIAEAFFEELQQKAAALGITELAYGKISRQTTYIEDYGNLDFEGRQNLIKNDNYQFDNVIQPNDWLLFIDDIHVTGSHQLMIEDLIEREQLPNDCLFLYYIAVANKSIDPKIENRLNFAAVQGVPDLQQVIRHPAFQFNTRIIKYILRQPARQVQDLLQAFTEQQIENLLFLARGNHYDQIEAYQDTFQSINQFAHPKMSLV